MIKSRVLWDLTRFRVRKGFHRRTFKIWRSNRTELVKDFEVVGEGGSSTWKDSEESLKESKRSHRPESRQAVRLASSWEPWRGHAEEFQLLEGSGCHWRVLGR